MKNSTIATIAGSIIAAIGLAAVITGGAATIEGQPKPTATVAAWPKTVTIEAKSLRRDQYLFVAYMPPGFMYGDSAQTVNGTGSWSKSYVLNGPDAVSLLTADGSCTIKVDGVIVDSDTGSEAECYYMVVS